jgi:hypothetical protein
VRLKLPSVALVAIDGSPALPLTELVIHECQEVVEFGDVLLLSAEPPSNFDGRWMRYVTGSIDGAMRCLWYDIPILLGSSKISHVFHVHWDAGIIDPQAWTDQFLKFDYIGAPWGWHNDSYEVGNGGFSLRSLKLMRYLCTNDLEYPIKQPEDDVLCRQYRPKLEAAGFKWAPILLASEFAIERSKIAGVDRHFGFHGIFNWLRHLPEEALLKRIALINDYVESRPEYREVRQQFLGLKPIAKSLMLNREFPPS